MKASAAMTRDVICLTEEEPLSEAWATMERFRIRHLPVFGGDTLVGIVSDRDVLLYASPGEGGGLKVPSTPVREVMTPVPITCRPTATIAEVVELFLTHRIDCVPVCTGPRHLVGLVTTTDLLVLLQEREANGNQVLPFEWRLVRSVDIAAHG